MEEKVILVDKNDKEKGSAEKMEAHKNGGQKHRAFSVLIFNNKGEVMLQQRAMSKYHCGGMWTNTCCSHPFPGEDVEAGAHRRLKEEMGFDTELAKIMEFNYEAKVNNELSENEYDHVFVGEYNEEPVLNKNEAMEWKWITKKDLDKDMTENQDKYTVWFRIIWEEINKR